MLMAEAKSGGGGAGLGSPITTLAPDHLFTILLLLPPDSILSFSMTCKRFKTLAFSDTLWESICRKEWGPTSIEVLKSSFYHHRLSWMSVYMQVSQLDAVSCHRLPYPDGRLLLPSPRASHSLNFVSDCLVVFGGGCEGGRHLDDTWVAYVGNKFRSMLNWQKVESGNPSGRFGHTCVAVGDYLVLFGGINDRGMRQNDTWLGHVGGNETIGLRFSWRMLDVGPIAPPPRGAHAACCLKERQMVINGGIGMGGMRLSDTWVLKISENLQRGTWLEISTQPSPPARSGHSLTCTGGAQMILFGGRGLGYEVLNDVWLLESFEDRFRWVQALYDPQNIPEGVSLPRVGHSANLIIERRLLIYGGEDSHRHRKDDLWVLDISAMNSEGLSRTMWKRLKVGGYKPNSRSFHRACVDHSGCYLYMFGGMIDGVAQPAEVGELRFDGELFLVELLQL